MRILHRPVSGSGDLALAVRMSGPTDAGPTGPRLIDAVASDTGVPVLLVHGMAGDHSTWRRFARALRSAGRSVISLDLRGHGGSAHADRYDLDDFRDDVRFVLDEARLDHVDVVGHSLGAHTALRVAMAEPERVRNLVLEEVPPMPRDQQDLDEEITTGAGFGERLRGLRALVADPRPVLRFDRGVADQVGAQFRRAEPHWWEQLSVVNGRTLVISGGPRSFLPPQHLRRLSESIPRAGFEIIDAGHSVHRDRRQQFESVVGDFLAG